MDNENDPMRIAVTELWLDQLSYITEIVFPDGRTCRKEYVKEGNEWRELTRPGGGFADRNNFLASSQIADMYEWTTEVYEGTSNLSDKKVVTGERLDKLREEVILLEEKSERMFRAASSQDKLMEARLLHERAQGMVTMLRYIEVTRKGK